MRVPALILVTLLVSLGTVGRAQADAKVLKVKTNQSTKLYAHPGEAGKVVLKVKSGTTMTVVLKEGRWLKVRVSGHSGYVPRSKVDLPDDDGEVGRNTRSRPFVGGRGTKRGVGGEGPDDRVGADAVGDGDEGDGKNGTDPDEGEGHNKPKKPTKKPDKADKADKGDKDDGDGDDGEKPKKPTKKPRKADKPDKGDKGDKGDKEDKGDGDGDGDGDGEVVDAEEKDTRVKTHVSEKAKIYAEPSKESDIAFTAKPDQELFVEESKGKWTEVSVEDGDIGWVLTNKLDMPDGGGESSLTGRTIDLRARAGFTIINQGLRSAGSTMVGIPDNYNVGTGAATIALGGDILYPYGKDLILGGEFAYDYDRAVPGVAYMGKNIGITLHNLDVRGLVGYDLHKSSGMVVYGRLGYHYQGYLVDNVSDLTQNTAKLPSEVFKAVTVGGALSIPKLTPKIGNRASLDIAALGTSLTQTKNLEDGTTPAEKMFCFGGVFTYRWKPKMDLQATYDLNYGLATFGPPDTTSMRGHAGTAVSRTDIFHTLSFGITYAL